MGEWGRKASKAFMVLTPNSSLLGVHFLVRVEEWGEQNKKSSSYFLLLLKFASVNP